MFYDLGSDVNIEYGGLFFDPEGMDFVEVIDLDSGAGVNGANLIIKGSAYLDKKMLKEGLSVIGQEEKEEEVLKAFDLWQDEYMFDFDNMPEDQKNLVLLGARAVYSYMSIDGYPAYSIVIVDENNPHFGDYGKKGLEEIKNNWQAHDLKTSDNVTEAIWEELQELGVDKPES